jgi:hypothetical protein
MRFLDTELAKRMPQEFAGKRCWVYVRTGNSRSQQQNRYYWGVVLPFVQRWIGSSGQSVTTDALHEYFRAGYLSYTFVAEGVDARRVARSTASLSVEEMAAYIDAVSGWCIERTGSAPPQPPEK